MPTTMGFHRIRAYALGREFYGVVVRQASGRRDWRDAHLIDQLLRASSSICLNIAEGAGEFSPSEKNRFFRMARRSAWECAAAVDLLASNPACDRTPLIAAVHLLDQIAALLTTMIVRPHPNE